MIGALQIAQYILLAGWFFVPAGVSNMAPCFLKGKNPVDMGRNFVDGNRFFGDGKTIEGLIGGTLIGTFFGILQIVILYITGMDSSMLSFGQGLDALLVVFLIALGALFGDLIGSFIKRRLKLKRGQKAPLMDQYNLVFGVFVLLLAFPIARPWFLEHFIYDWHWITLVTILVMTYVFHRVINLIAHALGLKKVPW
jgi:CDP-2,3-bis-(O-geranylgeranyl)-sn-glycerol synthase